MSRESLLVLAGISDNSVDNRSSYFSLPRSLSRSSLATKATHLFSTELSSSKKQCDFSVEQIHDVRYESECIQGKCVIRNPNRTAHGDRKNADENAPNSTTM